MFIPSDGLEINGGSAWASRAEELAGWSWAFANRVDAWGGYHPMRERGKKYTTKDGRTAVLGHVTTRPAPSARGKVLLTREVLARHFAATAPETVVGLHTTAEDNTSRWGAAEVDQHGDGGNSPEANLAAALAWYAELVRRGFRPLLTDSNGKGGYHLRFLLAEAAPTGRVFAFLRRLTSDYGRHGLTARPETFPKQASVPAGRYGNWLRLPGRHHTRPHWSTVWDGSRWLAGEQAVALLLTFTGDPVELLPDEPPPAPPLRPAAPRRTEAPGNRLAARIAAYLRRLPNLGEGQGRDDVAYHFAAFLVRDLNVSDSVALEWLQLWDAGNHPAKGKAALEKVIHNAHEYGRRPVGCGEQNSSVTVIPAGRPGHSILRLRVEVR
jgi:hypothetical protein